MKSFFTIALLLCCITIAKAQKDTLWLDKNWKETNKENASFYRNPIQKEGKLYRVNDFYIDGTLQMTGLSKYKDSIYLQQAFWYTKEGKLIKKMSFDDKQLKGISTYYTESKDKKTTIAIEEVTYENGKITKRIFFEGDKNDIRYEHYYDKGKITKEIYYGKKGKKIGQITYDKRAYRDGKKVSYYYNPMRVKYIAEYEQGNPVFTQYFYHNGITRNRFNKSTLTETFYDEQNNKLGAIQYKYEEELNYKTPYEGKKYLFFFTKTAVVKKINTYEKGKLKKVETFNKRGILIKKEEFGDKRNLVKVISYDDQGTQIGVLEQINDKLEGRVVKNKGGNKQDITYKNGIAEEVVEYYKDTTLVFSHLKNSEITYYDISGKKLGRLKVKLKEGYYNSRALEAGYYSPTPIEGTLYKKNYRNKISEKESFKDGEVVERTKYDYKEDNALYKETRFYEDGSLSKIISYYINGGKKSEVTYKLNSYRKKLTAIYYDKSGKVIANYNFITKTGTEYKYFYKTDQIEEVKELNKGKLIKSKRYQKVYNSRNNEYVLREDIDVNSEAKFYSKEGKLIGQATFTNQKPTGVMYDYKDRIEINVKNGLKEGVYKKFEYDEKTLKETGNYVNDKKHGTFIYYKRGKKQKEENYYENKKEGYSIYYDEKGKEISRLLYKKGKPFEGQKNDLYGTKKTYKNGALVKKIEQNKNQKIITEYISEKETSTTVYNLQNQLLLTYKELNNQLEGEVVQYEKNKPKYTAVFSKGKLVTGIVYLKANSRYQSEVYLKMSKVDEIITIQTYNEEGKLLFTGEINPSLYKEYSEQILPYKLGIREIVYNNDLFILE